MGKSQQIYNSNFHTKSLECSKTENAAYAACSKYLNLFMNPAGTAGSAMSAYTGQNSARCAQCKHLIEK